MTEIWKDIVGYEGHYQISNLGRVKSIARNRKQKNNTTAPVKERILKQTIDGYSYVHLSKNGISYVFLVHRIMWEAFYGPIQEGLQINHKDEDKTNNILSNLELCTAKYNMNYGTRTKRSSEKRKTPIIAFDRIHRLGTYYKGLSDASIDLNISKQSISNCLRNRSKKTRNYRFEYA